MSFPRWTSLTLGSATLLAALTTSAGALAAAPSTAEPSSGTLAAPLRDVGAPMPRLALRPPVFGATNPELDVIDRQLDELVAERAESSLGGPIALMAGGGGVLLISVYVLLLNSLNASTCNDAYSSESCWNNDKVETIGLVGLVAGGGMLLGGGLWLGDRVGTRRELGLQIKSLQRRRESLLTSPSAGSAPASDELGALSPHGPRIGQPVAFRGVKLTLEF